MDLSLSGLATGFDWKTVVDKLIEVERIPQNRLKTEKSENSLELNALTDFGAGLGQFQEVVKELNDSSLYTRRATTLSNEDVNWTAIAADGAPVGDFTFSVDQLATRTLRAGAANVGGSISTTSDVSGLLLSNLRMGTDITDGRFHINGQAVDVELTDTLQDIFDKIATATNGQVSASYDQATDRITLSGVGEVVLGAGNDTSNFLFATRLYNNGTSNVTSSGPLGTVDLDQPIATSGLIPVTAVDGDGNGRFFINGTEIAFNINTDSVQTVMTRINSSDAGASIDYDPNSDRFALENAVTGDRGLVVSEDPGGLLEALGLMTGASETRGQNAEIRLDGGSTLISAGNTFDDTLHGVTGLNVTALETGTQTITVASDTEDLKAAIDSFIGKYNDIQTFIDQQTAITVGNDGEVTTATLASNREVDGIGRKLRNLIFGEAGALEGTLRRLEDLGIGFESQGYELSIKDQAAMDAALADQLNEVQSLFNDPTNGLANQLVSYIDNATDGALKVMKKTIDDENASLDAQIAAMERRIASRKEALTLSFIRMEEAQSAFNSQLQALTNAINQE
jgi:flagellar hook-associated protein 2